jgi:nucleotide-binding universal stress UspA family protein
MSIAAALALLFPGELRSGGTGGKTTILIQVDSQANWRDLAFLAAIPAAERAGKGGASLIAVDGAGADGREMLDYEARYQPDEVVAIASGPRLPAIKQAWGKTGRRMTNWDAASPQEASLHLSRRFWSKSSAAVVVRDQDFESALLAAPLASLLQAPLLISPAQGGAKALAAEIKRLGVKETLVVGTELKGLPGRVVRVPDSDAIVTLARKRGLSVRYLAAVNPQDRSQFVTRKLSMVGAQLAAGRGGLVVPLSYATEWKRPFETGPHAGPLPRGVASSQAAALAGTLDHAGKTAPFILTARDDDHGLRIFLDPEKDGNYSESYQSGDIITLGGRTWMVSLGKRTKFGESRVHLTWPTTNEIRARLERAYQLLGSPPQHLCLVGFPDALPHAIYGQGGIVEEQTSDLPYAKLGKDKFASVGVARLVAESLSLGTLYAARVLTFSDIYDPAWGESSGQAEWENTLGPLFENVGFRKPYQLAASDIPWEVPPNDKQEGKRAASFAQESPLARSAILAHSEHSWWQSLGSTFRWDATVLLAPTLVESGGCATASLDREPDNRSVVARLLRQGAIGFSGGSRELPAQSQPLRGAFWNGILAGETLGQAHLRSQNTGLLVTYQEEEGPDGPYRYCTQVHMAFGDPALAIRLPKAPQTPPARTVLQGTRLSVYGPGKWWVVKGYVPYDWEQWRGKDLYYVRGPGAFSMANWTSEGRDQETPLVKAEFKTPRIVRSIVPLTPPASPLGWLGKWYSEMNHDGTYTTRFAARMIDFDQVTGTIRQTVDRLEFAVEF